jgi:hypothetical protein
MSNKSKPFNLALLDTRLQRIAGLLPVKSLEMFIQGREFHPTGLYSDLIFGPVGSDSRMTRHGYINLRTQILHPKVFEDITRLKSLYKDIMQGRAYAVWDAELKDFVRSDVLEGETGYAFFMKHFKEIEIPRTKSYRRDIVIDLINKYRDKSVLNFLIVMPAGLRDLDIDEQDRPVEQEINKLYRKVIAATNGISEALAFKNDPVLNATRWSIQSSVQQIWTIIMGMLGGKQGFLQSKWGSRRVAFATANVISAMDPAGSDLDGPRSFDLTTTQVGIYQFIKGTEPVMTGFQMPNGIARDLIAEADYEPYLIDPKTLTSHRVKLDESERVSWATEAGRAKLIKAFSEVERRHRPIMVNGHYLKLVYQDEKGFKLLDSIAELPEDKDTTTVRPLTWAEYFYIEAQQYVHRVRCYITRYPVTGQGSTYPSTVYLRSTVTSHILHTYSDSWELESEGQVYPEFPNTAGKSEFISTTIVSPFALAGLGADFDGDE